MAKVVWMVLGVGTPERDSSPELPPQVYCALLDFEVEANVAAAMLKARHPNWLVTSGPVKVAESAASLDIP